MAKGKMKIIEFFIRFIFIILFLVSFGSVSMGGVATVYYCSTKFNAMIVDKKRGSSGIYENFKFKFKLTDTYVDFGGETPRIGDDVLFFGKKDLDHLPVESIAESIGSTTYVLLTAIKGRTEYILLNNN